MQRDSYFGLTVALSNVKFFRMAKVKSAGLRNYVGRLGGNVYYINKGQNISRELAPEVSNPRTPAQMRQRLKWANIVNVYKANKGWMGHLSFENKPQTWSYYNAFMSANIGSSPVYLIKQIAEQGGGYLAPYKMTEGSLPSITYAVTAAGPFTSSLKVNNWAEDGSVGSLSAAIIANNPGWRSGDQLSFIFMYRTHMYRFVTYAVELILDPNSTEPLSDYEWETANLGDVLSNDGGYLLVDTTSGASYGDQALCMVHSRTENGKTFVSTQSFSLNDTALYSYREAGSEMAFQDAYMSYGVGDEYFLATSEQGLPSATTQIEAVVFAGARATTYGGIDWDQAPGGYPAQLIVIMSRPLFGAVSLRAGGVSLTPQVIGRQIHAEVTEGQGDAIAAAATANQKIVVTDGTDVYEWS